MTLPPGQRDIGEFPRFGLWQFATAIESPQPLSIQVSSDAGKSGQIHSDDLDNLERVSQTSDFHCVTTWSCRSLHWEGYRFRHFSEELASKHIGSTNEFRYVVFRADDGYRTYMYMEDLMNDDVLLADTLNGNGLDLDHGAPLRLIAPAHYGFKNAKHISHMHFCNDLNDYKSPALHWHESKRGRVALEERGWPSARFWRVAGRLAIPTVLYAFRRAKKLRSERREKSHE